MQLKNFEFIALDSNLDLSGFDCGDQDISDWLKEDAFIYRNQRMANTYLFHDKGQIVAYFCMSNDALNDLGEKKVLQIPFGTAFTEKMLSQTPKGSEIIRQLKLVVLA